MAKKKAAGKVRQHKQRPGKRLGLKIYGGQKIKKGQIIVKQRGTLYFADKGVGMGRDHTLFGLKDGIVKYKNKFGKVLVCIE